MQTGEKKIEHRTEFFLPDFLVSVVLQLSWLSLVYPWMINELAF